MKPPKPFTFRPMNSEIKNTVIDMANVRLGSVVGTNLKGIS
jgi:hypothetical protein